MNKLDAYSFLLELADYLIDQGMADNALALMAIADNYLEPEA